MRNSLVILNPEGFDILRFVYYLTAHCQSMELLGETEKVYHLYEQGEEVYASCEFSEIDDTPAYRISMMSKESYEAMKRERQHGEIT